jgi:hypothetical protein
MKSGSGLLLIWSSWRRRISVEKKKKRKKKREKVPYAFLTQKSLGTPN